MTKHNAATPPDHGRDECRCILCCRPVAGVDRTPVLCTPAMSDAEQNAEPAAGSPIFDELYQAAEPDIQLAVLNVFDESAV